MQKKLTHFDKELKHRPFLCLQIWRKLTHFDKDLKQRFFVLFVFLIHNKKIDNFVFVSSIYIYYCCIEFDLSSIKVITSQLYIQFYYLYECIRRGEFYPIYCMLESSLLYISHVSKSIKTSSLAKISSLAKTVDIYSVWLCFDTLLRGFV